MAFKIRKAAVLGAGTMGASIAAHLANVGIPSYLLDIVPRELTDEEKAAGLTLEDKKVRDRLAVQSIERLKKMRPAPFYDSNDVVLLTPGNMEDDLDKLAEVDWIIEVVVENLEIKKNLLGRIEEYWKEGTIVSTNTSGISVNKMVEDCSDNFKKHFMGTHFFNPPRYMKLLEIIPGEQSDPEILSFMQRFCEKELGKGVVFAKDTPNFIANRIGVYGMVVTARLMEQEGLSVEEVDAVTGPAMGRPKSASFRTLDMVGLDVFLHVAQNVRDNISEEWEIKDFEMPAFTKTMAEKGWLGEKTKSGFYKVQKTAEGKDILALDYTTMEYRPRQKAKFGSIDATRNVKGAGNKVKTLVEGKDKGAVFAWKVLKPVLVYSAVKLGEIADDIVSVDRAMRWGFNWDLGPFELWDALGVQEVVDRMQQEGDTIPAVVQELLDAGHVSFYKKEDGKTLYYDFQGKSYQELQPRPGVIILNELREQKKVVKSVSGASLVDIGDNILCLEFHSPAQAIGPDVVGMLFRAVEEVEKGWDGLVIANQGRNFSVGANLMMILMEAQADEWDEIDLIAHQLQQSLLRIKYCEKPVVAAPHGMTLGGGYEGIAHAHRIRAAAETYMGLVELGVGVIPAGGGCKEMVLRSVENVQDNNNVSDLLPYVRRAFETVAMARVATSAKEGFVYGYMRPQDSFTVNGDRHIYEAKNLVKALNLEGFKPPERKKIRVVGEPGYAALKAGIYLMKEGNYISEYDAYLGDKLAYVFSGGRLPANTWVDEQYLLDLEREAFLHLCGQPKTQQRMVHMLKTNKPLRN